MKTILSTLLLTGSLMSSSAYSFDKADVLIRVDDVGMSHSVNMAVKDFVNTGVPFAASVMVPCPWLTEAVELLKDQDHVSVGLHLTLTSEFKEYKWAPVAGKDKVPSLVGDDGYFRPSVREFLLSSYTLSDIETEVRAQIELAYKSGLKFVYLDHHMGIVRSTPEIAAVIEKVAKDYGLVISRYYKEVPDDLFHYAIEDKASALVSKTKKLKSDQLNMLIMHPGHENSELSALTDMNSFSMIDPKTGESIMAAHRDAELEALLNPEFQREIRKHNVLNYNDIIKKQGPEGQVRGGILYTSKAHSIEVATKLTKQAKERAKKLAF